MKLNLDLDEMLEGMTRDGMKKFVRKLITAGEAEEKSLLQKLKGDKNDLADLDEEMHGKHPSAEVEDEDVSDGELPDVPKKRKT